MKGVKKRKLTLKQERFVEHYFKTGNATDAARKSGYSKKTAEAIGQENLTKPMIVSCLEQLRAKEAKKHEFTREKAAEMLQDAYNAGKKANQTGTMVQAVNSITKMFGLNEPDKTELTGSISVIKIGRKPVKPRK